MLRQTGKIMTKSSMITNRLSIANGKTDNRLSFQLWFASLSIFGTGQLDSATSAPVSNISTKFYIGLLLAWILSDR